ncbi:MAG: tetratricopeptide repeat protein [Chitinophagales bacterium]|nr:tetratricopeptide repeat protein [Chitinophagales bacterium]
MKDLFYILVFLLGVSQWSTAQNLEEEIGFVYVKAEYLFNTGRYEEAIGEFTKIIDQNPKYKDALMYRGFAKMEMGLTEEAKNDAVSSIEMHGIQATSAALLGRAFGATHNYDAAVNSMTAAIALDNQNGDYYKWRATYLEAQGKLTQACQDYGQAVAKGNQDALGKVRTLCGGKTTPPTKSPDRVPNHQTQPADQGNPNDIKEDEVLADGDRAAEDQEDNGEEPETYVEDVNMPSEDNTINGFDIDDDLSIEISGQELGLRKIEEVPSILILADENGKVTINICVNKTGEVTSAEYNGALSTIAKKALVSLAIRKAKEFEFETGKYDNQCGIMVFKIKGN